MGDVSLGVLEGGPHAALIDGMARLCAADAAVRAIWVGGSLAAGTGDVFSDVDFRVAVAPEDVEHWVEPDWSRYLPSPPCGGVLLRFGERALLHHLVLEDGAIVDFYVQDVTSHNYEPHIVVLLCRDEAFRVMLEEFLRPAAALVREIDGAVVRQFFVDYWISTHKQLKALARKYDYSLFAGLYMERMPLLRAWHMELVGLDIDGRATLHMIGALHKGLAGRLSAAQSDLLGAPSRTPEEAIAVIEGIRAEMARVGRWLAARYAFEYPHELEAVVLRFWEAHKAGAALR